MILDENGFHFQLSSNAFPFWGLALAGIPGLILHLIYACSTKVFFFRIPELRVVHRNVVVAPEGRRAGEGRGYGAMACLFVRMIGN